MFQIFGEYTDHSVSSPEIRTVWNWTEVVNHKVLHKKKSRFTEAQIFNILKEFDAGKNILDVAREHGVSKAN